MDLVSEGQIIYILVSWNCGVKLAIILGPFYTWIARKRVVHMHIILLNNPRIVGQA